MYSAQFHTIFVEIPSCCSAHKYDFFGWMVCETATYSGPYVKHPDRRIRPSALENDSSCALFVFDA